MLYVSFCVEDTKEVQRRLAQCLIITVNLFKIIGKFHLLALGHALCVFCAENTKEVQKWLAQWVRIKMN